MWTDRRLCMSDTIDPADNSAARWHDDAAWYRALTLAERCLSPTLPAEIDAERADRRLNRWRSEPPFDQPDLFQQRLAADNLTERELHALLGESAEQLAARQTALPDWLRAIKRWIGAPATEWQLPASVAAQPYGALLTPCAPLLNQTRHQLEAELSVYLVQQQADPALAATLTDVLFAQLPPRLSSMISRTLVLELNVARVQGKLSGATSASRFESFVEQLRQPDAVEALLREYPVLARLLVEEAQRWREVSAEFVRRLVADRPLLERWLDTALPLNEISAISEAGDPHRGGRNVRLVQWRSGARLVYKPRSLAVDQQLQQLLRWLNERGAAPQFSTVPLIDRGDYGWSGWIAAHDCATAEQIERFYQRQGAYLALLHMLGAIDLHAENIIAAGEHPVMIDVEALFQPSSAAGPREDAQQQARDRLAHSVLSVGLLPQRVRVGANDPGIEIGGLGAAAGQRVPQARIGWAGSGTDQMRLVVDDALTTGDQNRPTLAGVPVDPLGQMQPLEQGFNRMYDLLIDQREALLAADGPLAPFADAEVRLIARPTATYERLRLAALHPDVLRDALDRERLLDRLYAEVTRDPTLVRLIGAERRALLAGDIPLFTSRPASLHLWSGDEQIPSFATGSGLEAARHRLRQFGPDDLSWQRWVIHSAMATFTSSAAHQEQQQALPSARPSVGATSEQLLLAASRIGDRLHALSVRGQNDATWIGLVYRPGAAWQLAPLELDLHSGLAGIALFLAYLGAHSDQPRYTDLAEAALAALRRQVDRQRGRMRQIGAFSGWGGIIYTLAHLGQLWHAPALLDEAEQIAALLPSLIPNDTALDVMDGAAGCALSLGALAAVRPTPTLHELLRLCGERLRATAQPMPSGCGWSSAGESPALAGLSHGAAGIAWAIQQIAAATNTPGLTDLATAALSYERALFVAERGNWPDLRSEPARFMTAWCHGATGIGLARLQMLPLRDDALLRDEIAAAVSTTLREGWGRSHALCHGDLGNLELLLQAGAQGMLADWQTIIGREAARVLDQAEQDGWRCGLSVAVETPGLMVGLAGIGYGLLRLAAPTTVPSVLTLAAPLLH